MPALTGDRPITASGTVTLTMIVNLKRFVQRGAAPRTSLSRCAAQSASPLTCARCRSTCACRSCATRTRTP